MQGLLGSIRKSRLTWFFAVLTIAVALGVSNSVFGFLDAVFLRPLGFAHGERLIRFEQPTSVSYPEYEEFRDQVRSISPLVAVARKGLIYRGEEGFVSVIAELASPNYFQMVGKPPLLGRYFTASDVENPYVIVLSSRLWKRRFESDKNIVGSSVRFNEGNFTVIGVAPEKLLGTNRSGPVEVWLPCYWSWEWKDPSYASWSLVGQISEGHSLKTASAELAIVAQRLQLKDSSGRAVRPVIGGEMEINIRDYAQFITFLSALCILLIVLACFNTGILLVSRAFARQRETAVQMALGCSPLGVFRLFLKEALAPTLVALPLAVCVRLASIEALAFLVSPSKRPYLPDFSLDYRSIAVGCFFVLLIPLAACLWPTWQAMRLELATLLKGEATGAFGASRIPLSKLLVAAQVAVSLALSGTAGLLATSLYRAYAADMGFVNREVVVIDLLPALHGYDRKRASAYYDFLRRELLAFPAIRQMSLAFGVPLYNSGHGHEFKMMSRPPGDGGVEVATNSVSAEYFETLGIPILQGRPFSEIEEKNAADVVVLSQSAVRLLWPGQEDPVGQTVYAGNKRPRRIIGIARDIRAKHTPEACAYLPFPAYNGYTSVLVHTGISAASATTAIRNLVIRANSQISPLGVTTIPQLLQDSLFAQRMGLALALILGGVAFLLSSVGLYGMVSSSVFRRRREIGIRIALGAQKRNVLGTALTGIFWPIMAGVIGGVGLCFALSRWSRVCGFSGSDRGYDLHGRNGAFCLLPAGPRRP